MPVRHPAPGSGEWIELSTCVPLRPMRARRSAGRSWNGSGRGTTPTAYGLQIVQVAMVLSSTNPRALSRRVPPAVGQRVWRRTASRSWSMSSALWEKAVTNRTIPGSHRSW